MVTMLISIWTLFKQYIPLIVVQVSDPNPTNNLSFTGLIHFSETPTKRSGKAKEFVLRMEYVLM